MEQTVVYLLIVQKFINLMQETLEFFCRSYEKEWIL